MALLAFSVVLAVGCDEDRPADADTARVTIDGRDFFLELALDNATRTQGLSFREHIEPDGGMLFVFRNSSPRAFVMRDCFVPIDIIYLDASGRIVAMHEMQVERPRGEGEGEVGEPNPEYEARLKQYSSRYDAQFVIELAGGTIETLNIDVGDLIELDRAGLERRAR